MSTKLAGVLKGGSGGPGLNLINVSVMFHTSQFDCEAERFGAARCGP